VVSELTNSRCVGAALTLQTAAGFILTVASIRLVGGLGADRGWRWAVPVLAVGPTVGIIDRGSAGAQGWLESLEGLELIAGEAVLEGPEAVRVDDRTVSAPRIIIASGAEPSVVLIPGLDRTPYMTSDDILALTHLPRRLLIVGAGSIALELGQALGRLGTRVSMVEIAPSFLPGAEPELAAALRGFLEEEGLEILVGAEIGWVEPGPAGGVRMRVVHSGAERVLEADGLLVARRQGVDVAENAMGIDPHDVP